MIHVLIVVICLIAIIAVVMWFLQKVPIQPPLNYVIYAGMAILCILVILWLLDTYGGAGLRLGWNWQPVAIVA
jgi:hypothetical protein